MSNPLRYALAVVATGALTAHAQPAIQATQPVSRSTTSSQIEIEGVVSSKTSIANVFWVDNTGRRGRAQWNQGAVSSWRASVPLQPGANRVAVVAADTQNRSAAVSFFVVRNVPSAPPPTEIRAGKVRGMPVTYAVVNGWAIAEGDIILGRASQIASDVSTQGLAISLTSQLWPKSGGIVRIPYTIQSGSPNTPAGIAYVNSALSGIVQWVPRTSEPNYVTFDFDPDNHSGTCYSAVGMAGGQQFIGGSIDCHLYGGYAHEMGHAMGLLHEHQRPNRNGFVTFMPENADRPNIAGNMDVAAYNAQASGPYDWASVMHYRPFNFSKAGQPVFESIPAGMPLGETDGYSPGDIDQIKRLYRVAPSQVTITTNPPGLQILVDGVAYTSPHTFAWALNTNHQVSLPPDPQQTNPADGSLYRFGRWNDGGARSHVIAIGGGNGMLNSPMGKPAITVYQASFVRLQPFSAAAVPAGSGTIAVNPPPQSVFGGTYFVDRQQITLDATPAAGRQFYGWFGLPYPQGGDPYSLYVSFPLSGVQAAFTTFPVTLLQQLITGPNTWNPPLYAYVDGGFVSLPQRFSQDFQGSGWAPGTTHTVNAPSPNIPVTTNATYTWNNWSDSGAQTHQITASTGGVKTVTASYTPSYRSYAYSQQPCSSVQYSQACPNNDCNFGDGTVLTMTASADPGSNLVFAGWTGSLSGLTNPQMTTVHDQFVPVANFNLVPAILSIGGFNPANAKRNSNPLNLVVQGTGFVNGSFYAYWNGSYRTSTVTSPTRAVVQLVAGDLANAGAQTLDIGNFSPACGATAYAQYLVKNTVGTPRLGVTKRHTGNFTRGGTGTYTVVVTNTTSGTGPTTDTVTLTEMIPAGLTLASMSGTGWSCAGSACTRGDALVIGKSYPPITVQVNVLQSAPASVTNKVKVTGGNSPPAVANDVTTIQ